MKIEIRYFYDYKGLISTQQIEEKNQYYDVESVIAAVTVCLRHMRKSYNTAIHVTIDGATISAYPGNLQDWENGIVCYMESQAWNDRGAETRIPFAGLKKLLVSWIKSQAEAEEQEAQEIT